ncbi:hypothetical protein RHGRI_016498 [Rhododendron griersonianum]|uniref:PB1 domain-containing protein n=1 Tax=Rhododendron griersonianum TaxID=479676 RepID=A0AAV6JUB4_9ERIC|nr:hypothetical protein RHGRI_016498 [Rhododendron griersonianum]
MENYPYSNSYPDSGHSSPRSREIDCENASWDDQPLSSGYKVKLMCSYGGKIHPRPHDNQLTYVGGDTKILAVDRNIRFSSFISKLSNLCDSDMCFRYQLPGEDLDALISVTNDEDLEHMMMEYDRLYRASNKPARMRLFLFPANSAPATTFGSGETKSERQWFVDALNSVQIQPLDASSPPTPDAGTNPDFLFGLDKGHAPLPPVAAPVVSPSEIQRQMHEFQRLQISGNEQGMYYRKIDEPNPNYYNTQKVPEKLPPAQPAAPVTVPASYWQERNVATGGYPVSAATAHEPPVYLIQTPTGMYHAPAPALRPVTSQFTGQGYYGMQRVVPEMYREQPMYNPGPQPSMQALQQQMVRPPAAAGVGIGAEQGYSPVTYEGRQMYYTTAPAGVVPPYQAVNAVVDLRQGGGGGGWNAEGGKFVGKGSESSSL